MSLQSDAAKKHIDSLLKAAYPLNGTYRTEYRFCCARLWRFDWAVPSILCANLMRSSINPEIPCSLIGLHQSIIELDGGTFQGIRSGHSSGDGLRNWREKNNAAMSAGWHVWHYAPEEVIKSGRKTLPDEPILKKLPWM